jgi:hypothetical protein
VYYLVDKDGAAKRMEAAPAPRNHTLVACEEVPHFVEKHAAANTVVWFDRAGIVVLLDDATRRDRTALALTLTPQMKKLADLSAAQKALDPIAFNRMLRVEFAGCLEDPALVEWVSDCYFVSDGQAMFKLRQGADALGSEIRNEAKSERGLCPEFINVKARVFDDPSVLTLRTIRCAVEIDPNPEKPTFSLTPLPLQVHEAIEAEVRTIGELLRETLKDKAKIFRGKP